MVSQLSLVPFHSPYMAPKFLILAQVCSIVAFLSYGTACFISSRLVAEFKRWGLEPLRKVTGGLEIAGALGLLIGFFDPIIRTLSAAGLSVMMICAVLVRAKIRDRAMLWAPAVILLLINLAIAVS